MSFLIMLIVCIINLSLGFIVLIQDRRSQVSWSFFVMTVLICTWVISSFLTNQTMVSLAVNDIGNRVAYGAGYGVVLAGLWFTYRFPVIKKAPIALSVIVWVGSAVVLALSFTKLVAGTVTASGDSLTYANGPFIGVYIIAFLSIIALIVVNLLRLPKGISKRHKRQSFLVLAAFAFTATVALLFNVLIPLLTDSWESTEFGPIATILLVIIITYAMIRHGLFDIRSAVVRTVTYILSLATLTAVYFAVVFFIFGLIFGQTTERNQLILNVLLTLTLCFLFQPIRRFFDKLTNKVFFQDEYNVDDFFAELSRALTSTNDLHDLLLKASEKIADTMKASSVSFVVYNGIDRSDQVGSGRYSNIAYKDVRWLDDVFTGSAQPKIVFMLEEEDEQLRRMMVSHRIVIILPLLRQGVKMGYLFLGEHRRSKYTNRDIRIVQSLADELVIAIQNALSFEEVKELNSHLEQRVDAATKELRRSNAQLQKIDESKDEFMSMASHQLRTPLTSIKGYISMLMEGDIGKITPEQKHVLSEAFISSERMVRLVSDFLNVSRLQTGRFVIDKHPVDLALLIQREIDSLAPNALARDMKFVYKIPKNIPQLELDENKIQQVVMNFSDNALYYSKDNGKITLTLKKIPGWVEFIVKDNGIGVPEEEQAHLFNKFFRATNAKRARPDGTGVGLFLAKKVIDEHDGEIIFESKEGKGSSFGFRLPLPKKK